MSFTVAPELAQKAGAELGTAIPTDHKVCIKWKYQSAKVSHLVAGTHARHISTVTLYIFRGSGCGRWVWSTDGRRESEPESRHTPTQ